MNTQKQNAEILRKLPPPPTDAVFSLRKVDTVILPHPYVIGPEHLHHSHGGVLDDGLPCHECKKPASEHVARLTLFVRVPTGQNRDLNAIPGLGAYLSSINETAKELGLQGYAFPDKDPRKISARVASGGQGCALDPPSYPNHFKHLKYSDKYAGSGDAALSSVIEDEDGYYAEHLEEHLQKEIRAIFAEWESTKPPLEHPRTVAWMVHVYNHLQHCYKDDNGEAEPPEYSKPATLIFPVPFYKLRHFHDDPRFSEEWRKKEIEQTNRANEEIRAKYAKVCTPENHAAVRFIRQFYPEHQPRLGWIIGAPPRNQGDWYEKLETQPTPENCPGDTDLKMKHPVNGSWCQFCGWYAEETKKEQPCNATP